MLTKLLTIASRERQRIKDLLLDAAAEARKWVSHRHEPVLPGESIRVAFLLHFDMEWDCFAAIHRYLSRTERFSVTVVAAEPDIATYSRSTREHLDRQGITYVQERDYDVRAARPHVIFVADSYSTDKCKWVLRSTARTAYIPYGTSVSGEQYSRRQQYNLAIHNNAWRIFVAGEFVKRLFDLYCEKGGAHVVPSGHPKVDTLYQGGDPSSRSLQTRRVLLWNVHYRHDGIWSTWREYGDFILDLAAGNDGIELVFRPHPFFFDALGSAAEARRLREWLRSSNVALDESPSCAESFRRSDALLTDGSSIMMDYAYTLKPMLHLRAERSARLNEFASEFISRQHYIGDSKGKIREFVNMIVKGEDRLEQSRRDFMMQGDTFPPPDGTGERVARYIERALIGDLST